MSFLAMLVPSAYVLLAWALWRGSAAPPKAKLGRAGIGLLASFLLAIGLLVATPQASRIDALGGLILLALAWGLFGVCLVAAIAVEWQIDWLPKLLVLAGVGLLLIPGACFGTVVLSEPMHLFKPYHP